MIFIDGVGLGKEDPQINPFMAGNLPTLNALTNGKKWTTNTGHQFTDRAIFIPTDPRMGIPSRPQSATGQATIVTGKNIPALVGRHYGPKPNPQIREILDDDNIFKQLISHGKSTALLEAYPPGWHKGITSGKNLPASYQYALMSAGLSCFNADDLKAGKALSGDWTGKGWKTQLGFDDIPEYMPQEAGKRMVHLSRNYDFAFMSHWLTDVVGHRGKIDEAIELLETFDGVIEGVLAEWQDNEGVVIITSDHGNIEEIGNRRHTTNDIPTVFIGDHKSDFAEGFTDLTGYVKPILELLLD